MTDDTHGPHPLRRSGGPAPPLRPAGAAPSRTDGPATPRRGGLYEGRDSAYRVLLFVELDLARALWRVSGDFFRGEPTEHHVGWFYLPAPQVTTTDDEIQLKGMGRFTFAALAPLVVVRLPIRVPPISADRVSLAFLRADFDCGAHYLCDPYAAPEAERSYAPAPVGSVVSLSDPRRWQRR